MAIRAFKPTSPGRRAYTASDFPKSPSLRQKSLSSNLCEVPVDVTIKDVSLRAFVAAVTSECTASLTSSGKRLAFPPA